MALFQSEERVEVASKEQGYTGSYYEATVIQKLAGDKYVVEYKNLVKEDFSGALQEVVGGDELRPVPMKIPATGYRVGEFVDADDLDGWWVGKIVGKLKGEYVVYFDESSKDRHVYPANRLRIHQDWIKGRWVSSRKNYVNYYC